MRRRGLGEEDLMHKTFGGLLKVYEGMGKLNCQHYSYDASGEKRDLKTGALLKAKGLKPGAADYSFKMIKDNIAHYTYIEFKTQKGKQSDNQKLFEKGCCADNEDYYIVRSVNEAITILEEKRII